MSTSERGSADVSNEVGPALAERLREARRQALLRPAGRQSTSASGTLDDLIERTAEVYASALSDHTRLSYASRWKCFEQWVRAQPGGLSALPALPETVMLYLAQATQEEPPASLSTLRGRLAAINRVHTEQGHKAPGDDPAMGILMRGLGRVLEKRPPREQISALRITELREAVRAMDDVDPTQTRDRALLALVALGFAPEVLCHLRWEDVRPHPEGLSLHLRRRPGQEADPDGTPLRTTEDGAPCAVEALLTWQAVAGQEPAHVFTVVDRLGQRGTKSMHAHTLHRIVNTRLDSFSAEGARATVEEAFALMSGTPSATLRDKVVLLVGFAGAFRRNELCLLRWSDVKEDPDGVILRLRRSKTDVAGKGRNVGIPYGRSELTCPVRALWAWKERMQDQLADAWHEDLPVLVRVGRAGRVGEAGITPAVVTRIVVARARSASLAGHWGGRSLRAGFITTAADLDIPLEQIAEQSRHASLDNLIRYIRADDPFRRNAADWVGL